MSNGNGFRPTEAKIMALLSDGLPHTRQEVHACLPDELSSITAIKAHLTAIRKHLRPIGQDILCVWVTRKRMYRLVRLVASANDGRK